MPTNKYGVSTRSKRPQDQVYSEKFETNRLLALERDHYRCRKCGCSVKGTNERAVHHIISKSKGGTDDIFNLATECKDCHIREHPHLKKLEDKKKSIFDVKRKPISRSSRRYR